MYTEEKDEAREFLALYGTDIKVIETLEDISNDFYIHSDRWSIVFDMIFEYYPEYRGTKVVTGLVYLVEDGEI
jgi:hypothetical protein